MCRQTNETLREQIIQNQYTTQVLGYANIIFGGWDYALSSEKSAYLKQRAMLNEIRGTLEEDRVRMKRKRRDTLQRIKLYFIRILINLIVIAILGGSGFLIYYATTFSAEMKSHEDYADKNQLEQFLFDFIPSLTITGLNAAIPILFAKIVKGEDYKPDFEIRMTLGRTVFLRLASVAVLMGSLYYQITCSPKDSCNVGTGDCVELRCWETFFGQQIYRLMIVNAVTKLGIIFFVEFPRKIIVTKIKFKLTELVGRQEFDIPKQVLDLVYGQTLCWLGAFFAPLTPVIFVILYFLLFYAMLATCMINYVPATKPYRSSKSHMFFMLVLITAFILCCIPIGYCIWQISPSRGCGPFRLYDNIYDILSITIDTSWPEGLRDTVHFFTSSGFLVGLFVCLILIIYYYKSAASGRNDIIQLLRDQISIESREKQFLLKRLNENGGAKSKGNDPGGTKYQSMGETQPLASP